MKSGLHALVLTLSVFIMGGLVPASMSPAMAQGDTGERAVIEIVQIMHRDPDRIRQAVRSVLDPRGSIGQVDDKLVIATTATNFLQIQALIADTDVPPRRLVIGVDFAYQPDATDDNTQQQSQAIEGQELVFIASGPADDMPETDDAEVTSDADADDTARITIAAEIVDNGASVNLRLDNVPELSGNHILRVPLGVWQLIETPVPEPDTETDTDADADAELQPTSPSVAVRVDRVP